MIVVKKCNKCGRMYDAEFMSDIRCQCSASKIVKIKVEKQNVNSKPEQKTRQKPRKDKWDNVSIKKLPIVSNKREKEAVAIMTVFNKE